MVSICTGAFALAAAGVLDGRRATTHWRDAADLAARYPRRARRARTCSTSTRATVLTSAGVASGLDLCLHILRRDHGAALASHDRAPDRRPAPPRGRPGPVRRAARCPTHAGGSLAATRAWALERLHEPLTVRTLAAHAHVSERTFARRFSAETGVPVLRWLLAQRVDAARAALESTDASIDEIADRCGFGTAANLRKHFHRQRLHHPDGLPPRLRPLNLNTPERVTVRLAVAAAYDRARGHRDHASTCARCRARGRRRPVALADGYRRVRGSCKLPDLPATPADLAAGDRGLLPLVGVRCRATWA